MTEQEKIDFINEIMTTTIEKNQLALLIEAMKGTIQKIEKTKTIEEAKRIQMLEVFLSITIVTVKKIQDTQKTKKPKIWDTEKIDVEVTEGTDVAEQNQIEPITCQEEE